jgi:hypothetical protein
VIAAVVGISSSKLGLPMIDSKGLVPPTMRKLFAQRATAIMQNRAISKYMHQNAFDSLMHGACIAYITLCIYSQAITANAQCCHFWQHYEQDCTLHFSNQQRTIGHQQQKDQQQKVLQR